MWVESGGWLVGCSYKRGRILALQPVDGGEESIRLLRKNLNKLQVPPYSRQRFFCRKRKLV